jgi:hypothetical protein
MATDLHDVPTHLLVRSLLVPQEQTESDSSTAVNIALEGGDGGTFAIVQTGAFASGTTLSMSFEESADGVTWATIPDPLAEAPMAEDTVQLRQLPRTLPLVRAQWLLTGGSASAVFSVLIGEQRKFL